MGKHKRRFTKEHRENIGKGIKAAHARKKANGASNKSDILFKRLDLILSQTAIDLDMTVGEVNKALMLLLDSELNNQ